MINTNQGKCYYYDNACNDVYGKNGMLQGNDCCFLHCNNEERNDVAKKAIKEHQVGNTDYVDCIKIAFISDFGHIEPCNHDSPQYHVLQEMKNRHHENPYDFIISSGDNVYQYDTIVDSIDSLETQYDDEIHKGLNDRIKIKKDNMMIKSTIECFPDIPILATSGNHDYNHSKPLDPCRILEQINYSYEDNNWFMPNRYWSIKTKMNPSKVNFEVDSYLTKFIFIDTSQLLFLFSGIFNKKIKKPDRCIDNLFTRFVKHYKLYLWYDFHLEQYEWLIQELLDAIVTCQTVVLILTHYFLN